MKRNKNKWQGSSFLRAALHAVSGIYAQQSSFLLGPSVSPRKLTTLFCLASRLLSYRDRSHHLKSTANTVAAWKSTSLACVQRRRLRYVLTCPESYQVLQRRQSCLAHAHIPFYRLKLKQPISPKKRHLSRPQCSKLTILF